jgi:hypothetical protein
MARQGPGSARGPLKFDPMFALKINQLLKMIHRNVLDEGWSTRSYEAASGRQKGFEQCGGLNATSNATTKGPGGTLGPPGMQFNAPDAVAARMGSYPGGWRGLHMTKTRVTFGRGPDVMAGAGTGHRSARMSRWEGAHATLRSGPVGDSVFFP